GCKTLLTVGKLYHTLSGCWQIASYHGFYFAYGASAGGIELVKPNPTLCQLFKFWCDRQTTERFHKGGSHTFLQHNDQVEWRCAFDSRALIVECWKLRVAKLVSL